jgi:CubicO group peptidase (beta-lactamase class C family)
MRLAALLLFSTLFSTLPVYADALDDAIVAEMKRSHVPGVSIAVVRNGKIVKERGYGLANIEHGVKVGPQTVFQSGSVGKTFTAALVLLLEKDGKLKLDDPISRHLANTPKAWEAISIRHLLTHTSGLGDPYAKLDLKKDYSEEELLAIETTIPTLFAPGEKWAYSNMGYHLLGFICNKVGGKFYGDQLRERIFLPLGMSTRIISESDIIPHRSSGYERSNGQLKNQQWVAPKMNTTADGSLYLTARDLALWDLALYGDKILDARMREASWTPAKLNDGTTTPYGYGWQLSPLNGHRSIAHGGSWQGFKSQINRYVDDKLTVIVLANAAQARPSKIANLIAKHYVPELEVKVAPAIADTEPAVASRVREVMERLIAGIVPPGLGAKAAQKYSPELVKSLAAQLQELGTLRTVELLARKVDGEERRYRYRFTYSEETVLVDIAFGKSDLVEQLGLRPE